MKQIARTIKLLIQQSWITLSGILILAIFLYAFTYYLGPSADDSLEKHLQFSVTANSIISFFMGIYLGGGIVKLRQTPYWQIYPHYRKNLLLSFVIAAFFIGFVQSFSLVYSGWDLTSAMFGPVAIIILAAQMLCGRNMAMNFLMPVVPFLLFQLPQYQVSFSTILILLVLSAVFALISMLPTKNMLALPVTVSALNMNHGLKNQINNPIVNRLNRWCIDIYQPFIETAPKGKIIVALLHPSTRLGTPVIITVVALLIFCLTMPEGASKLTLVYIWFIAFIPLILLIEIQALATQTKSVSHIFSANQHQHFKTEILKMLDRKSFALTAIFTLLILLLNSLLQLNNDVVLMLRLSLTVTLLFVVMLPLMLCLDWFNIGFKLLGVISLYGLAVFFLCRWHYQQDILELLKLEVLAIVAILTATRFVTLHLWKRQSIEVFMRTYG